MEKERVLAHIEIIKDLQPIENSDNLLKATVLGWEVVVNKKEGFKIGDKVIYIEVDSVMPEKPEYEFLRERKFRIRTIKLRGQVSQGMILPCNQELQIGKDMTSFLGITKYLSSSEQSELQQQENKIKLEKNRLKKFMMRYSWYRRLFLSRTQSTGFPYWISKTDEERCIRR